MWLKYVIHVLYGSTGVLQNLILELKNFETTEKVGRIFWTYDVCALTLAYMFNFNPVDFSLQRPQS